MIQKTFLRSAEITEATQSGNRVRILIKASTDKTDLDGDRFLPQAWSNDEDRQHFLQKGVIDWNHLSRLLKFSEGSPSAILDAERARSSAIIGEPIDLDVDKNALFCKADLYPENAIVRDTLTPALKSHSTRFGASVGGGAYPPSEFTKAEYGDRVFDRAVLDHIAICPLKEARNDETMVSLMKSIQANLATREMLPGNNVGLLFDLLKSFVEGDVEVRDRFQEYIHQHAVQNIGPNAAELDRFFKSLGIPAAEATELVAEALIGFGGTT